jgi:hypothetical protein
MRMSAPAPQAGPHPQGRNAVEEGLPLWDCQAGLHFAFD